MAPTTNVPGSRGPTTAGIRLGKLGPRPRSHKCGRLEWSALDGGRGDYGEGRASMTDTASAADARTMGIGGDLTVNRLGFRRDADNRLGDLG